MPRPLPSLSRFVAALAFLLQAAIFGEDLKPVAAAADLAAAAQFYRAGKFAEAETGYQAALALTAAVGSRPPAFLLPGGPASSIVDEAV